MKTLIITTQSGSIYDINSDQQISRTDMAFRPSDQWLFVGIIDSRSSRLDKIITFDSLKSSLPESFVRKSGAPAFKVVDVDHGTLRIWGDGIVNMVWVSE